MYSKTSKWINVLSILLALLSMGELIFTASALYLVTIILSKTEGYTTTICGLIASLVSMPTAFKVRSFYSSTEIRVHHFDMQTYHRFMLYISLAVQTFCIIICCYSLTQSKNAEETITSAITSYQRKFTDKKFVDVIQILFQCCGTFSFQDWAQEDWLSAIHQEIFCDKTVELREVTNQTLLTAVADLENVDALYSVPYSCCKVENSNPCRNFDLKCSGIATINTNGCLEDLTAFVISILFSEFVIFTLIIVIIVVLLKLLIIEECEICRDDFEDFEGLSAYLNDDEADYFRDDGDWQKFTNSVDIAPTAEEILLLEDNDSCICESSSTSTTAELVPTVQEQLVLSNDSKAEIVSDDLSRTLRETKSHSSSLTIPPDKTYELIPTSQTVLLPPVDSCSCSSGEEDDFLPKGATFKMVPTERDQLVSMATVWPAALYEKKVRFK